MHNLSPLLPETTESFLPRLRELVSQQGSPLNVVFPQMLQNNVDRFSQVFSDHAVSGQVYYAAKANKSDALMIAARKSNAHIDVASYNELTHALASGFTGKEIEATGPKNERFIALCLLHDVLINVDSRGELERIITMHARLGQNSPARILFRLNEFRSTSKQFISKDSRFGMSDNALQTVLKLCRSNPKSLQLQGFSFHLATTSTAERVIAFETAYRSMLKALEHSLEPAIIDIGGGFSISYLESRDAWQEYISALKQSIIDGDGAYTWDGNGLGFWNEKATLRGQARFPEFYREVSQFEELDLLLQSTSDEFGATIADLLKDSGFSLMIEPGRSLLDQVGLTACSVLDVKTSAKGENIVVVNMNRSNMNAQDLEYMADPILLTDEAKEEPFPCFIAGNLCLPHDFITKRKVWLPKRPESGDILVFHNTAGYYMDFSESETLRQPLATKLAVELDSKRTYLDSHYPLT